MRSTDDSPKRLIIADAHVGTRSGDVASMTALIDRAGRAGIDEIVYLGDTFVYLIGMSKFWTDGVRTVLDAWSSFRARGGRIRLIEGNRDFFLDEPELAEWIDEAARAVDFTAGTTRFLLVHGDKVNQRDRQYLFWSRISKCRVARWWARRLPRRLAVSIVRKMEARLAETNRRFRYAKPIDALEAEARRAFAAGVDVLLFGHFHTLWEWSEQGRTAMVVPAWLEQRKSVLVDQRGNWFAVDEQLERTEFDPEDPADA